MQCSKCAHENPAQASICLRCGVVFEKYYKYHPRPGCAGPGTHPRRGTACGN